MATSSVRTQFLREPAARRLQQIASSFGRVAACITQRQPPAHLAEALAQSQALCQWAAPVEGSTEGKALLTNLQAALETWQQVWPRLGARKEFRLAVAREAGLWSRRLQAMAADAKRS